VADIYFLVPTPEELDQVKELAVTINARLVDMGIPEQDLRSVRLLYITRREARSARKVSDLLLRGRSET